MLELFAGFCLTVAWLVPNHYPPWTSFYNESLAAVALLLFAAASGRRLFKSNPPDITWVVWLTAVIPLVQWAAGILDFSGDAWVASLYLSGLAVAIATGYIRQQKSPQGAAALLSGCALAAALASSMLALTQALQIGLGIWVVEAGPGMRPYANLGQPNNLSTLIGLALAGLFLLRERRRLSDGATVAALTLLLVGLALAQSRTALAFGPILGLGLWFSRRKGAPIRTSLWVIAGATLAHWVLALALPKLQELAMLTALPSESVVARGMSSPRFQMWPMLISALDDSPWQGFGWLQVGAAEFSVVDKFLPVNELWLHGHNLFIELLVWCGYPLGALLILLIAYWFVTRWIQVRTIEGLTAAMTISVFSLHALLELPHHYAYFLIPIGLWVGAIEFEIRGSTRLSGKWTSLPTALALVLWVMLSIQYIKVEEDFRRMRFETLRIGPAHVGPGSPDAPLLSSLTEFLEMTRTPIKRGMSQRELDRMEAVVKRYPYTLTLTRFAAACALNGRQSEARATLLKLRNMYDEPTYLAAKRGLYERAEDGSVEFLELNKSLP